MRGYVYVASDKQGKTVTGYTDTITGEEIARDIKIWATCSLEGNRKTDSEVKKLFGRNEHISIADAKEVLKALAYIVNGEYREYKMNIQR